MKNIKFLTFLFIGLFSVLVIIQCKTTDSEADVPVAADRDKFIGSWTGNYQCGFPNDSLTIFPGTGELDVFVVIHTQTFNPDTVTASLTKPNYIVAPEQTMGGVPGTLNITYVDGTIDYRQSGLGITCPGNGYEKYL